MELPDSPAPLRVRAGPPPPTLPSPRLAARAPRAPRPSPAQKRLSVERIYQKKSQLEHILLRPDPYIGSVETVTQVGEGPGRALPAVPGVNCVASSSFSANVGVR